MTSALTMDTILANHPVSKPVESKAQGVQTLTVIIGVPPLTFPRVIVSPLTSNIRSVFKSSLIHRHHITWRYVHKNVVIGTQYISA